MSEIFIHVSRGNVIETMHRGDAVVVTPSGEVVAAFGDSHKYTYFRSAAKPIQAINVITSGAMKHFQIDERELSVICSSHYSEAYHLQAVSSILAKIGLNKSHLLCGAARSIRSEIAFAQAESGILPERIKSDCSGKHSGMLATCLINGYSISNYLDPHHPVQQDILNTLSKVCHYPTSNIQIGIDGCGVPVFALPVYNMALGFARFANESYLPEIYQKPARQIFAAMTKYPEMVSGTGGFCTALMQATKGRMIGKIGAAGIYCIGMREPELGIALKIEDGAIGMAPVAAMHILKKLELLSDEEYSLLREYHHPANLNDEKHRVGEVKAVF